MQVNDAPKEVNTILESAYRSALKKYPGNKAKASKIAWGAVKNAGWSKDKEGKWAKAKTEMSEEIEIDSFKAGKYPQGEFTEANIDEVCETYNPSNYEAPVLIGHVSDYKGASKIPAFGWIAAARNVAGHLRLSISQFSDELKDLIKGGYYKKVSAAFYDPQDESNPTPGKWHLHHLAFLGGTPPQVKGLEGIAFAEINGVGVEFAEEEPQMDFIDKVEEQGKEGTKKDIAECLAELQSSLEEMIDNEEDHDRMVQEVYEHVNDIMSMLNIHDAFQKRLEDLEENEEGEYSEQKSFWHEFKEFIANKLSSTNQKKGSNVTDQEKAALEKTIADQKKQIEEFAEKQKTDELKLADERLKASIHSFCETNGLNINKAKELKVEDNLFIAAKANGMKEFSEADNKDSFNSLKGIFSALNLSPVSGEMREFSQPPPGDEKNKDAKIVAAEQYIKDHLSEFSESPEVNLRKALLKFI